MPSSRHRAFLPPATAGIVVAVPLVVLGFPGMAAVVVLLGAFRGWHAARVDPRPLRQRWLSKNPDDFR